MPSLFTFPRKQIIGTLASMSLLALLCARPASAQEAAQQGVPASPGDFVPAQFRGCPALAFDGLPSVQEAAAELVLMASEDSKVWLIQVSRSSGHAEFDRAAVLAAVECSVAPGQKGGKPISAWIPVQVQYRAPDHTSWKRLAPGGPVPQDGRTRSASPMSTGCPRPLYPKQALRQNAEGTVGMLFKIDPEGLVGDHLLAKSSGSKYLDSAAIETLRKCRFNPSTIEGTPVESWYLLQYRWYFG